VGAEKILVIGYPLLCIQHQVPYKKITSRKFYTSASHKEALIFSQGHIMAVFADNDIQKLLQQAEQRLSGDRIVAKQASTALTTAKPVGEDVNALAPKPEKVEVRVPQAQIASQRKGKVRINTLSLSLFPFPLLSLPRG
jgi:hypothetical protein